ncbi:hypothetical protein [Parasedimentitalea marina]|uniref:hypothetical protein n=1 Tax=Parasedimentitalea marina TaxID=2483033 RepID=UPI0013E34B79|nr:hypothetical protein [Parasedimentitalea marina]
MPGTQEAQRLRVLRFAFHPCAPFRSGMRQYGEIRVLGVISDRMLIGIKQGVTI